MRIGISNPTLPISRPSSLAKKEARVGTKHGVATSERLFGWAPPQFPDRWSAERTEEASDSKG
jgi:hypothetical protein